jgi:hypothetical protein
MRFRFLRLGALACLLAALLCAQQQLTVEKLTGFIDSSIKNHISDREVAAYLATARMSERLTPSMVEDMQGKGAGPKTLAALQKLAELSSSLAPAAPKAPKPVYVEPPPPPREEQDRVIREITENALTYSKSLPDFICLQVTRRSIDLHYQRGAQGSFSPVDRILERLTYFDQKEKYEPISMNDKSLYGKNWESMGGSFSRGEFGTALNEIFTPESQAEFGWDHWGNLRGKLCYVFRYRIEQSRSKETISYNNSMQVVAGYTGQIYVQKGPNKILRITIDPKPPADFPVQDIHQVIDYNDVDIAGEPYLLPFASNVQMRDGLQMSRNEIEFRSYHKYSAGATITFDDVDTPLPDDQKTEQKPDQPKTPAPKPPPKQ